MNELVFDIQRFADDDSELSADEKQRIRESSLPHLRMISNVAKVPIFSTFVTVLENNKDTFEFIDENVSPIFNLVGALYNRQFGKNGTRKLVEEAAVFSSTVKIVDSILDFFDNLVGANPNVVDKKFVEITNDTLKICNTISKLQDSGESGLVLSLVTASLSYGLTVLNTIDGIDPGEQIKINKAFAKLGYTAVKGILKELGKESEKFTAPFGLADLGISAIVGAIEVFSQKGIREEYYSDDGLPEDIARKEALLDALSSGLHEAFTTYLKGADDVAFRAGQFLGEGCKWLAHAFTGDFSYEMTISEMNYMDFVRELAKRGEYNSTNTADAITVSGNGTSLYAQDGDDYIENFYSNVTILAGHGNDIVSSYGGAKYNSIFGGNGNDYLYIHDNGSTVEGGNNDDHLLIYKDKNKVYGGAGNDILIIQGDSNIVSGGTGTDLIELNGATNSVIEYTQGDGADVIFGYDESTLIKIKSGDYSTCVSGNDAIIIVGKGGIIIKDAKDLKLNINTIELEEGKTLQPEENTFISNPYDNAIILTPGLFGTEKALRGTNNSDRIENTLDNVMIYGFSGDDNDYIYNEADKVTVDGGAGKDTIENSGKKCFDTR